MQKPADSVRAVLSMHALYVQLVHGLSPTANLVINSWPYISSLLAAVEQFLCNLAILS